MLRYTSAVVRSTPVASVGSALTAVSGVPFLVMAMSCMMIRHVVDMVLFVPERKDAGMLEG